MEELKTCKEWECKWFFASLWVHQDQTIIWTRHRSCFELWRVFYFRAHTGPKKLMYFSVIYWLQLLAAGSGIICGAIMPNFL